MIKKIICIISSVLCLLGFMLIVILARVTPANYSRLMTALWILAIAGFTFAFLSAYMRDVGYIRVSRRTFSRLVYEKESPGKYLTRGNCGWSAAKVTWNESRNRWFCNKKEAINWLTNEESPGSPQARTLNQTTTKV